MTLIVLLSLLLAPPAKGDIAIRVTRIDHNPEVAASSLLCATAKQDFEYLRPIEFNYDRGVLLMSPDASQLICAVPTKSSNLLIDEIRAGKVVPDKGEVFAIIHLVNLLPKQAPNQDRLNSYLWKYDSVRRVAFLLVTAKKGDDGSLHIQFWGKGDKPLSDAIMPFEARKGDDFAQISVVENELECVFFERYKAYLDLIFFQFDF